MSDKERPLPKQPHKAFGGKSRFEQKDEQSSLLADRMAAAAAEGRLDEFLKQEMPDNEYARNLASMMMGMTGITPGMAGFVANPEHGKDERREEPAMAEDQEPAANVPDDVRQAIASGDIQGLMGLLRREHARRNPDLAQNEPEDASSRQPSQAASPMPTIDKDLIEALVQMANDNSVTLDWIMLRAIKLYVQEYQKSGKL